MKWKLLQQLMSGMFISLCWVSPTLAQTVTATVGTGDVGTNVSSSFTITGGTQRLNTLFHSFETFSPESANVLFQLDINQSTVNSIVGRVTGNQESFINGELTLTGGNSPDVFLINPNGIRFGTGATLSLPGSFVASTAESISFNNDAFSATNPDVAPLLSVSVPTGLQMGTQSGAITLLGTGHSLEVIPGGDPRLSPYRATALPTGLIVQPSHTLGLVGNRLNFTGSSAAAPSGRIDLISLSDGQIDIIQPQRQAQNQTFALSPTAGSTNFSDINLDQRSLVDVSGLKGSATGDISLRGQNIRLTNGSVVWAQNRGIAPAGMLVIDAAESLSLSGALTQGSIVSSIITETGAPGAAGNMVINAPLFTITDGSGVGSRTVSTGASGRINITTDALILEGYAAAASSIFSRLGTYTLGKGDSESLTLNTDNLTIREGGSLGSTTLFNTGQGGDVTITAKDIEVSGATPTGELSLILASAGTGNAGALNIVTERLSVTDSGSVSTSSFNASSGNIDITATEWIRVSGQREGLHESIIASGVVFSTPAYQALVGNVNPTGDAGQIEIKTQTLQVDEGGVVNVANVGAGRAGALEVQARNIFLNGGDITATTASGQGGDITLRATDILSMRQGSNIQATSLGTGNGGNIKIEAPVILGRENSDIVANAVVGQGGNINITTEGILGFQFRGERTPQSDITASSEFGVEGSVDIVNTGVDINSGLVSLPAQFADADGQITAGCSGNANNQFVASGRGGLPTNPLDYLNNNRIWQDWRAVDNLRSGLADTTTDANYSDDANYSENFSVNSAAEPVEINHLLEASRWQRDKVGKVVLTSPRATTANAERCLQQTTAFLN